MTAASGTTSGRDLKVGIGAGVIVTGDVHSDSEMQISGEVNGDVRCSVLFIEAAGRVNGNITADQVRISGTVEGNVETGDLAIEQGGKATGNISYARLKVSAGGIIAGMLVHNDKAATASSLKLVEPPVSAEPRRVFGE